MPLRFSPLFSWLSEWSPRDLRGTLVDIFVTAAAGQAMRRLTEAQAIAGQGLAGDRYASGQGHWQRTDACQVTLVTEQDLLRAERRSGLSFGAGEHRRNLVISGIPLDALRRRRVQIGEAVFAFHRLRPPCAYLDRLLQPGAGRALGRGAGIGLQVLQGGRIRIGDAVVVLEKPPTA